MAATDDEAAGDAPAARPGAGRDPWLALSAHTTARIALGRAGGSLRTQSLLEFRIAHARARDAVHEPFDVESLSRSLQARGLEVDRLATAAPDRHAYLARPDLGRRLDPQSAERLRLAAPALGRRDLAILVSDGLSAAAAASHAVETVAELDRILGAAGWTLYPIFLVPLARVKLQDAVGEILGARHSLILLGERPGLSAQDSLGAYMTFEPRASRTDADRNCVSNIRGDGLPPHEAAAKIAEILVRSRSLGMSGTGLRAP